MAVGRARSSKNAYIVVSNVSPSKNAFCIGLRFFERVSLTRQNRSCPIHALPKKNAPAISTFFSKFQHSFCTVFCGYPAKSERLKSTSGPSLKITYTTCQWYTSDLRT